MIIFNLKPDFAQLGEINVTTGGGSGTNTTLPAVYTAEDLKKVQESESVAEIVAEEYYEPGTEPPAADADEPYEEPDVVVDNPGNKTIVIYMVCFIAIIAATAGIIIYITKKPAKKGAKK